MHETAVVMGLIGILDRKAIEHRIARVSEVRVKLGRLRGLDARQLVAVFEVLSEGGRAEGARLVIEDVAVTAHCRACGHAFTVEGWQLACPACGADAVDVLTGRELHIDSFDGVREAEEGASG